MYNLTNESTEKMIKNGLIFIRPNRLMEVKAL